MNPTHLRHTKNGRIFEWSKHLATHKDLVPHEVPIDPTDYSNMSWKDLKKEVESMGHVYTSKADAIALLEGD